MVSTSIATEAAGLSALEPKGHHHPNWEEMVQWTKVRRLAGTLRLLAREFDVSTVFELADSNMNFNASPTKVYEPSGATGKSDWNALFTYILDRFRERSTAFVLVDDRDLT